MDKSSRVRWPLDHRHHRQGRAPSVWAQESLSAWGSGRMVFVPKSAVTSDHGALLKKEMNNHRVPIAKPLSPRR